MGIAALCLARIQRCPNGGDRCLSQLRFLRSPGRFPETHSRPVSSQHARLDSTLSGVPRRPLSLSSRDGGREPRSAASTRHPPAVEARPTSLERVEPSPLGLRPSTVFRVAAESGHRPGPRPSSRGKLRSNSRRDLGLYAPHRSAIPIAPLQAAIESPECAGQHHRHKKCTQSSNEYMSCVSELKSSYTAYQ
jgi:hypothetical protein